ncbi:MAG TPA: glycerate kinase [Ktedonobacterales bacterium]|jgi:glycerate kinase
MKIVIAPQAFKGCLSAWQVARAIERGIKRVWPDAECILLPVADGGEGTVQALVGATGGRTIPTRVSGPLGASVNSFFGILGTDAAPDEPLTAVIEVAAACGLPLLPLHMRNPRITTTRGVGELIRKAVEWGCRRLIIGLGGSATNDGGAGMAQTLGVSLRDRRGHELPPGGAALERLTQISIAHLLPKLRDVEVLAASDVTNPLCGPEGATAIYGPQKGAKPAMIAELDQALAHFAAIIKRDLHKDVRDIPGAGAAGGMGAGLMAFLNAKLTPGAPLILDMMRMDDHLREAALVFTAEGRIDKQTAYGKAVATVAARAKKQGVPVIALAASLGQGYEALYESGISVMLPLPDTAMNIATSMRRGEEMLVAGAERAMRLVGIGRGIAQI